MPDTTETNLAARDYFTDHSILLDPYEYFEALREKGPVYRLPGRDIFVVTGFEESLEVLNNIVDFSSVVSTGGPAVPLPFTPQGNDLTPQIEAQRTDFLGGDLLVALDDKAHYNSRALLSRLFTPSRLKANETYMTGLAAQLVQDVLAKGSCEIIKDIAVPFATLVVADLLGVPPADRDHFMEVIAAGVPPGALDAESQAQQNHPLVVMAGFFVNYLMERMQAPREDVLTELAQASYPDGTKPDIAELVRLSTFLFGAGQDTTAKLIGNAMRFLIEVPGLQAQLRADPSLLPAFVEESLRLEGSTKMTSRLARKTTRIGGIEIPVGTKVMVALAAANRDPRRWENPQNFVLNRPRIKENLAFGRGAHVCIGNPLARVETRIVFEKLFEYTSDIAFDEAAHGTTPQPHFEYEPSFIIRGLETLHLKLTPAAGMVTPPAETKKTKSLFGFGKKEETQPMNYSTATTKIGTLLDDPDARAILDKHFPGVSTDPRIGMGKGMTLRAVQAFAAGMFTTAALDAVDVELAALGPK